MFKPGEKVICIDNTYYKDCLTINKIYIVKFSSECCDFDYINRLYIEVLDGTNVIGANSDRFISLKEIRKQKLEKICLK